MRTSSILLVLGLGLLLISNSAPAAATYLRPAFCAQPLAAAGFLQQRGAGRLPVPFSPTGGVVRGTPLGSSVFPTTSGQFCSVDAGPTNPTCSVSGFNARCTAATSDGAFCSVFGFNLGDGGACSTFGRRAACSVLRPPHASQTPFSLCSTFGPETDPSIYTCSTLNSAARQGCSVENPASLDNACSAFGVNANCSVMAPTAAVKSFCTAFFASGSGTQTCSTHSDLGSPSTCSVVLGGRGICTALKGAPANTCSTHLLGMPGNGIDHCSVIGGAAGGPVCRQP